MRTRRPGVRERRLLRRGRRLLEARVRRDEDGLFHVHGDVEAEGSVVRLSVIACRAVEGREEPLRCLVTKVRPVDGRAAVDVDIDGVDGVDEVLVVVGAAGPGLAGVVLPVVVPAAIVLVVSGALFVSWHDRDARRGHYEGMSDEAIAAELGEQADWYSMEISVASYMEVSEGESRVLARIENTDYNHCDQRVRIYDAENPDDVLYESGAISPGEHIDEIELAHPLPVGVHTLVVEFQGYERGVSLVSDEGVLLGHDRFGGSASAEVTLYVSPADAPAGGSS